MKSAKPVIGVVVILAVALGFYMFALSPKKKEASDLSAQIDTARAQIAQSQTAILAGTQAKKEFSKDYEQLVLLGKAVPQGDDTSSMMVQLSRIAANSHVTFNSLTATATGGPATTAATTTSTPGAEVPPTEVAASLLPIGATVGAAGLGTMPYDLSFNGDFFHVADFLSGLDKLVSTESKAATVSVDGRLLTINGFTLNADQKLGFPHLQATFSVTAYVTPPDSGVTAGASPTAPATTTDPAAATPTSTPADSTAAPAAAVTGLPK